MNIDPETMTDMTRGLLADDQEEIVHDDQGEKQLIKPKNMDTGIATSQSIDFSRMQGEANDEVGKVAQMSRSDSICSTDNTRGGQMKRMKRVLQKQKTGLNEAVKISFTDVRY